MTTVITLTVLITRTTVLATETRHTSVVRTFVLGIYHRQGTAITRIAHLESFQPNAINIKPGTSELGIRLDVQ